MQEAFEMTIILTVLCLSLSPALRIALAIPVSLLTLYVAFYHLIEPEVRKSLFRQLRDFVQPVSLAGQDQLNRPAMQDKLP